MVPGGAARPESELRDWYVWAARRPRNWASGVVFPGVQTATWTFARKARAYYFHRFHDFEPDLNMANPRVRDEVRRIMGFWLELGVAGFRMDAVPFVLEKPSAPTVAAPRRALSGCASSGSSCSGGSGTQSSWARRTSSRRQAG